jgi:hypothetical protein
LFPSRFYWHSWQICIFRKKLAPWTFCHSQSKGEELVPPLSTQATEVFLDPKCFSYPRASPTPLAHASLSAMLSSHCLLTHSPVITCLPLLILYMKYHNPRKSKVP